MKTFETEKSKIPEGATHYANESDVDYFLWCKIDREGKVWGLVEDEGLISTVQQIKKPRTKAEFVKVEFEKLSDAAVAVDSGQIYYTNYGEQAVEEYGLALHYYNMRNLKFYRKVETEIDERNEFIDEIPQPDFEAWFWELDSVEENGEYRLGVKGRLATLFNEQLKVMFDSGKFKLVE